jgi:hypothetical protein
VAIKQEDRRGGLPAPGCQPLDTRGILKAGVHHSGSWAWFRDESRTELTSAIGYEVNTLTKPPWVRLFYTFTERQDRLDYRIRLVTTRPRFGGLRWWFICPLLVSGRPCGRRVGKLHLPPHARYFGCRHCYDLTYTSCQESRKNDGLLRRIALDMGQDFATVKRAMNRIGMR